MAALLNVFLVTFHAISLINKLIYLFLRKPQKIFLSLSKNQPLGAVFAEGVWTPIISACVYKNYYYFFKPYCNLFSNQLGQFFFFFAKYKRTSNQL